MTLLRLSATGLARSHFAVSPLAETVGSLIALHRPCAWPWLARWHSENLPAYRSWLAGNAVAAGLLGLVSATKWFPDVVSVPPSGGVDTRLADELAEVAAQSDAEVLATIEDAAASTGCSTTGAWLPAGGAGSRIAAVLEEGWHRFVERDWPRRHAVIEREITYRAELVAAHGWQRAVKGMTRRSVWVEPDAIRFSNQSWSDRDIGDHGLVFVPYTARQGSWTCERPGRYALVYPARGAAVQPERAHSDPVSVLLGAGRARVAVELRTPATSTQLAAVLDLSLGTVSAHLAVLRQAGVVSRTRSGRHVVYRLTERGSGLLDLLGDRDAQNTAGTGERRWPLPRSSGGTG
ncbi:helix-turn-helix domain-containing protein [Lentzea sp. NPDC042327]|uniref:ArsR/SmtB family transcription factor n=1 Tax=Lentzea sp. NPDC042327 TaxID=3154801 RepID=UPI0033F49AC6